MTPTVNGVMCVHDLATSSYAVKQHDLSSFDSHDLCEPREPDHRVNERVADSMQDDVVAAREASTFPHDLLALVARAAA